MLRTLTIAILGLYLGGMLTEGFVLVPYWRWLPPSEFFAWYAANDSRLFSFFGAVTAIATLTIVADAVVSSWKRTPGWKYVALAAGLIIVAVLMFPLYFEQANASFAAGSVDPVTLPAALVSWATWHWLRTSLIFAALVASALSFPGHDR